MEKGIEINLHVAEFTLGSEPKSYTMNGGVFPHSRKWAVSCFFCMTRGITLCGVCTCILVPQSPPCLSHPVSFAHCPSPLFTDGSFFLVVHSCCYKTVFPHETVVKHRVCFLVFHCEVKSGKFLTNMALF